MKKILLIFNFDFQSFISLELRVVRTRTDQLEMNINNECDEEMWVFIPRNGEKTIVVERARISMVFVRPAEMRNEVGRTGFYCHQNAKVSWGERKRSGGFCGQMMGHSGNEADFIVEVNLDRSPIIPSRSRLIVRPQSTFSFHSLLRLLDGQFPGGKRGIRASTIGGRG